MTLSNPNIAIIGGGAAGFFAAIHCKYNFPKSSVTIFEKSSHLLAKVRVSGGGRCNVTNNCPSLSELMKAYPRGEKALKKVFHQFNTQDTMEWFESRGVALYTQENNCVFPVSNSSQSIIDCLLQETTKLGIQVLTSSNIQSIVLKENKFHLQTSRDQKLSQTFDKVIVASGGSPKKIGFDWLEKLGHKIEPPVPSLFTFNMPKEKITELMGVAVLDCKVSIQGSKLKSEGPLLITHWGMSGPAILKLSAFGARFLEEQGYNFTVQVNWTSIQNQEEVLEHLRGIVDANPKKILANIKPFSIPERLWKYLLNKVELAENKPWGELGNKGLNKLCNVLCNDAYQVKGKTTFKEEFVTCGGVSLDSINMNTMESKVCKNLYFAGEVMDIDAITGGYNFQAAWSTGFIAGKLIDS